MSTIREAKPISSELLCNTYSILGLPINDLTMQDAIDQIYHAIDNKTPSFISTPNLNFLISSQRDKKFNQSIINSDLCLADGMPLIWIAKLLRIPIKERIAGSDLIDQLMQSESRPGRPVKVFFFGGAENVASQACEKLIRNPCGIKCVGSMNPGFGTAEDMSHASIIEAINCSGAEFIIVSLGAKKGQEWIELNRHLLDAPVISHMGAVVNFIAGTVSRAPVQWRRLGLEWLWRIKEEPALWKRYFIDGLELSRLAFSQILPYALIIFRKRNIYQNAPQITITTSDQNGNKIISIRGVAISNNLQPVRDVFTELVSAENGIIIDLNDTSYVDPAFVGLLLDLLKHTGDRLSIITESKLMRRILGYNRIRASE